RAAARYSAPMAHTKFSMDFFNTLKFDHVTELDLPTIAQPGMIDSYVFIPEADFSAAATVLRTTDIVFHIMDIQPILSQLEDEFVRGNRAVRVRQRNRDCFETYHFSKIRLHSFINNFSRAVHAAKRLVQIAPTLSLPPYFLHNFLSLRILDTISGLMSSSFPIWQLVNFLDETWVLDDSLNALSELLCLRLAAISTMPLSFLFLPTDFFQTAFVAYKESEYTPNLLSLRERLRSLPSFTVGFLYWIDNHFTAYFIDSSTRVLWYGDSLGHTFDLSIASVVNWVLDGICAPLTVRPGQISSQPVNGSTGSGSCGIAAFNFVERRVTATVPWTPQTSDEIRKSMIRDLVTYHIIATQTQGASRLSYLFYGYDYNNWTTTCVDTGMNDSDQTATIYTYNDYNLFRPNHAHPIQRFVRERAPMDLSHVRTPFVDELSSHSLLPAISLSSPGTGFPSSPRDNEPIWVSSDDEKTTQSQFKKQNSSRRSPSSTPTRLRKRLSLSRSPSLTPTRHRKRLNLNCSPSIIEVSPPKLELEPETISLLTPDSSPTKIKVARERSTSLVLVSPSVKAEQGKVKTELGRLPRLSPEPGPIVIGQTFESLEQAKAFIFSAEERRGHKWVVGQTKRHNSGEIGQVTLCCNRYRAYKPTHLSHHIDPADFRHGKLGKTECFAHVNVVCDARGVWHVSIAHLDHNHERSIPIGGHALRPPTILQRDFVGKLSTASVHFLRSQSSSAMNLHGIDNSRKLEPHQFSNLLNESRRAAKDEIRALGGDVQAILHNLEAKSRTESGWRYRVKANENGTVTAIFWQSPLQMELARRYGDVLINDNSYNRVDVLYPLNTGIIIDGFNMSRNVWYCFQRNEDIDTFTWILHCYLGGDLIKRPEIFVSDRHASLIAVVHDILPFTFHIFCLHHLERNISTNLHVALGTEQWEAFKNAFWDTY
ncbi:hypothetical protein K435DRAFT_602551, partial [Dendrothele bispora CBS 962.96]